MTTVPNISGIPIAQAKAGVSGLRTAIVETLYPTSANMLADVCEGFGLRPGTRDEAFSSKRNYVMKRLLPLPPGKMLDLARQISTEYPNEELERAIQRASLTQPADSVISDSLSSFDQQGVHAVWVRALERRDRDAGGAITLARSLLETVCKHIINGAGETYDDKDDLPKLYRSAATILNLGPDQHTEDTFRRILGGCHSVVEGLGTMRNKLGDAHGRGPKGPAKPMKPEPRHAALAVNLSGAMATFLVETWNERKHGG